MPPTRTLIAAFLAVLVPACSEEFPSPAEPEDSGAADTSVPVDSMTADVGGDNDASATDTRSDANGDDDGTLDSGTDTGPAPSTGVAAYVWANNASSPSYTPDAAHAYNSSGGAIGVTRTATGTYAVSLGGINLNSGDLQLTAYGSDARCAISGWSGTAGTVNVVCRAPAGGLADSMFMLAVVKETVSTTARFVAYATANQPTATTSYAPEAARSYNASAGSIAAARTGTGTYSMTFAGLALDGGNVQVTAVGSDASHCTVSGVSASKVDVRCLKGTTPADSAYTVSVIRSDATSAAKVFAYALTNDSTTSYTPDAAYALNSSAKGVTAYYGGVGKYSLSFAGHTGAGVAGTIKVSSFNPVVHCKVFNWTEESVWGTGEFLIDVQCFDWAGAPANSRFMVLWVK